MTIDEAIVKYNKLANNDRTCHPEEAQQLAEWLEELKKRRSEDYGYMADIHQSIGYRKALDDFVEALVSAFDETNIKEYGFYPENLVSQVAKQLKEGNK
ncbi:MAG: hypothetical protein ACI4VC_05790 [Clostridia bacterium]